MKVIINKYDNVYGFHPNNIKDFNLENYINNNTFSPKANIYKIYDGKPNIEIICT